MSLDDLKEVLYTVGWLSSLELIRCLEAQRDALLAACRSVLDPRSKVSDYLPMVVAAVKRCEEPDGNQDQPK